MYTFKQELITETILCLELKCISTPAIKQTSQAFLKSLYELYRYYYKLVQVEQTEYSVHTAAINNEK